jgi:UDP-2,3-diacylglucosamine pyrophosphatase LpxH
MKHIAIFMSDFHLGQRSQTEDFFADEEFAELLGRLSLEHAEDKVDLVLLGDVLDLWNTVTDAEEVCADQIDDVGLCLPAETEEDKVTAMRQEKEKAKAILRKHPIFFASLGRFLVRAPHKRRIVYVIGNHDHSMIHRNLQRLLSRMILPSAVVKLAQTHNPAAKRANLARSISFATHYKDENLQTYAEHGNQFTYEGVFRYDDDKRQSTFEKFGAECPGYVHFKVVTSRVIRLAPKLNGLLMGVFNLANWPNLAVWLLVRGYFRALIYMQRFQIQFQYWESSDPHKWRMPWSRRRMPRPWKTFIYMWKARLRSFTKDEFGDLIPKLFEKDKDNNPLFLPLCGETLSQDKIKTIILGHSHSARNIDVPGFEGLKYYNTGSWTLRQEKNLEFIDQTWVSISTELPVKITNVQSSSLIVEDEFGKERLIKLLDPDALGPLKREDSIIVETDENGYASRIIRTDLSSRIIDRQLVRRRVERANVTNSPVTPDGARLNPELRSMNLQVGDLVLFHWNFGPYLWRLARSFSFGKLFASIPRIIIAFINRFGTSSYWNHIAMVYGSPSELRESEQYNDPLIIESVPNMGVRIYTPEHLQYPKEWDFAVLRLTKPFLNRWEARRLLRRITLNYLGAAYDKESVTRGTIKYAALATTAKGRSVLGGVVMGAVLGSAIISICAIWWLTSWLSRTWPYQLENWEKFIRFVEPYWNRLSSMIVIPKDADDIVFLSTDFFVLVVGFILVFYLLRHLTRLLVMAWVALTALIGALLGCWIVPVMTDLMKGWAQKSTATRWGLATIWFSPLLFLLAPSDWARIIYTGQTTVPTWNEYLGFKVMVILAFSLLTVLFAGAINLFAESLIGWTIERRKTLNRLVDRLYMKLKWPIPIYSECNSYPLHEQFICSGLVQLAFVETLRELPEEIRKTPNLGQEEGKPLMHTTSHKRIIGKSGGTVKLSQAEHSCIVSGTLHEHLGIEQQESTQSLTFTGRREKVLSEAIQGLLDERDEDMSVEQVVVNPDWKKELSRAEQSCILRDTLPRHFALEHEKFKWTYLYLDQVLTPNPSESLTAQAYTDPLNTHREAPSSASIWAIKSGFTGLILTLGTAINSSYLSQELDGFPEPLLFGTALVLGFVAIYKAKQARRDLVCNPNKRGRALTIGGFISGVLAILFGFIGLETLASLPAIIWAPLYLLLAMALLSGFLLLF